MKDIDHNGLGHAPRAWLNNRVTGSGIRGDREVPVADGYVTDYFALCSLQGSWFRRYCKHWGIEVVNNQYNLVSYFACLFEAKVTRSDFLSTFSEKSKKHRNRHEPVANLHWCVTPKKLINPDELPDFWGLLEWTGRGLREVKMPLFCQQSDATINRLAHKLIWSINTNAKYWELQNGYDRLRLEISRLKGRLAQKVLL